MTTVSTLRGSTWIAELDRRPVLLGALVVVLGYGPLLFLGPGTDLDVGGVYQAGRSILDGTYEVSRLPGAPVFETAVGVLHAIGGSFLVNLGSLVMTVVTALAVVRLLGREGHRYAEWFGLAVLVNPFVWVAGTSMVDYMWATAFVLAGVNLQLSRRLVPAAVLYALAAGCRLSTLLLVAAVLVADGIGDPAARRRLAGLAAAVAVLSALIFLPPFLSLGLDFLQSEVPTSTLAVQVGRFAVKNFYFFGPVMVLLVMSAVPRLWRSLPSAWPTSTALRFGVFGLVATQLLFLRFPWKPAHLIPAWLALLLILGATRVLSRNGVVVLLAAQLVLGVVTLNLAQPDQPDEATGGRFAPEILEGPLLRDIRCRIDGDQGVYRQADPEAELLETWHCVIPWSE